MASSQPAQIVPLLDLPVLSSSPSAKDPYKSLADFDVISVLGRGSYGRVLLVRRIKTNELLAMKVMTKRDIVERRVLDNIKAERLVLEHINHPYLVSLRYAFQTADKLYLLMSYQPGGEMFTKLERDGPFVEYHARFYLAEVLVAINYLHSKGIIYRDLKPENVLFQSDGHIALTDFGFAKKFASEADEKTQSFCGSLQYLAPEIVQKIEYGREVDIWCCGVFMYELLTQRTPFQAENRADMLNNILHKEVKYHKSWSKPLVSLMQGLLERDPKKRLTFEQIKKHPYFSTTDWGDVEKKKTFPPYTPSLRSDIDVSLFDERFTKEMLDDTPSNAAQNDAFRHSSLATLPPAAVAAAAAAAAGINTSHSTPKSLQTLHQPTTQTQTPTPSLAQGPLLVPLGSSSPSQNNNSGDREGLRHHRKGETPIFGSRGTPHSLKNGSSGLNLPPPPQFSLGRKDSGMGDPDDFNPIPDLPGSGLGVGGIVTVRTTGSFNLGNGEEMGDKATFRNSIRAKMASSSISHPNDNAIAAMAGVPVPVVVTGARIGSGMAGAQNLAQGVSSRTETRKDSFLYTSDNNCPRNAFQNFSYSVETPEFTPESNLGASMAALDLGKPKKKDIVKVSKNVPKNLPPPKPVTPMFQKSAQQLKMERLQEMGQNGQNGHKNQETKRTQQPVKKPEPVVPHAIGQANQVNKPSSRAQGGQNINAAPVTTAAVVPAPVKTTFPTRNHTTPFEPQTNAKLNTQQTQQQQPQPQSQQQQPRRGNDYEKTKRGTQKQENSGAAAQGDGIVVTKNEKPPRGPRSQTNPPQSVLSGTEKTPPGDSNLPHSRRTQNRDNVESKDTREQNGAWGPRERQPRQRGELQEGKDTRGPRHFATSDPDPRKKIPNQSQTQHQQLQSQSQSQPPQPAATASVSTPTTAISPKRDAFPSLNRKSTPFVPTQPPPPQQQTTQAPMSSSWSSLLKK